MKQWGKKPREDMRPEGTIFIPRMRAVLSHLKETLASPYRKKQPRESSLATKTQRASYDVIHVPCFILPWLDKTGSELLQLDKFNLQS